MILSKVILYIYDIYSIYSLEGLVKKNFAACSAPAFRRKQFTRQFGLLLLTGGALALPLEKHGAAHFIDTVVNAALGHVFGIFELLGRQVGGDDGGLSAFVAGVDKVVNLLQGKLTLALDAKVVNQHQVIGGQAVVVLAPVPVAFKLAGQVVSQAGEAGAQDIVAFVVQGVDDAAGRKGLSGAHIAVKQQADVFTAACIKLSDVALCFFDGAGAGAIVGLKGHSAQGGVLNMGCPPLFFPFGLLTGLKGLVALVAGFGFALAQAGHLFSDVTKNHPCLHGGVAEGAVLKSVHVIELLAAGVGIGDCGFKIHRLSPLLAV